MDQPRSHPKEAIAVKRRRFIVKAGGTLVAASAAAVVDAPHVIAQPKLQWRMPTTWGTGDVLQGSAHQFAKLVDEMSGGRLRIEVFPAGQLMPPFACFDETSKGTVEMFMGVSYYWAQKEPAAPWFADVPFGVNAAGRVTWLLRGGGLKLWEEAYAPFNLVPRPGPSVGVQMAGWFRKKINTLADYKGLRMRIPGLGGRVVANVGGTVVLVPGGEIYAALERGVIDAAEWIGPHDDMKLGLHTTARYYYYPGWHEPGGASEFVFNKKLYEGLSVDLRRALDLAAVATQVYGHAEYEMNNAIALEKLKTEFKSKVEILQLPAPVLRELKKLTADVLKEESEKSPMARQVYASFTRFQTQIAAWSHISEGAYQQFLAG
jgi:TRAP-type mannitol/chloroaromatic compound transport system substrate-binding protein